MMNRERGGQDNRECLSVGSAKRQDVCDSHKTKVGRAGRTRFQYWTALPGRIHLLLYRLIPIHIAQSISILVDKCHFVTSSPTENGITCERDPRRIIPIHSENFMVIQECVSKCP